MLAWGVDLRGVLKGKGGEGEGEGKRGMYRSVSDSEGRSEDMISSSESSESGNEVGILADCDRLTIGYK